MSQPDLQQTKFKTNFQQVLCLLMIYLMLLTQEQESTAVSMSPLSFERQQEIDLLIKLR